MSNSNFSNNNSKSYNFDYNYDYDNDEIRKPDRVIREKLIDYDYINYDFDNNYNYHYNCNFNDNDFSKEDDDINQAIKESLKISEENEEKEVLRIINETKEEIEKRGKRFEKILVKLKRIGNYDKIIKDIYNILQSTIDSYVSLQFDFCYVEKDRYDYIFNNLKTVKLDKEEFESLKMFIICKI
jgi:hypothetical protein